MLCGKFSHPMHFYVSILDLIKTYITSSKLSTSQLAASHLVTCLFLASSSSQAPSVRGAGGSVLVRPAACDG